MSKFDFVTFNNLNREDPLHRAIYNIWAECVFNESPEAEKVEIAFYKNEQRFSIHYEYNGEEILNEKGRYYFTEDGTIVIYLDDPTHCQKFIAFERTQDYMEIAYI